MIEGNEESLQPLTKVLPPNNPEESLELIYEVIGRDEINAEIKSQWIHTCGFVNELYELVFAEIQKKEVDIDVLKKRISHILLSDRLMSLGYKLRPGTRVDFGYYSDLNIEEQRFKLSADDCLSNRTSFSYIKAAENLSELIIGDLLSPNPDFNRMMFTYFNSFADEISAELRLEFEIDLIFSLNMPEVTDLNKSSLVVDDLELLPNSRTNVKKIHFYGRDFKGRYSVRKMIKDLQEGRESTDLAKKISGMDIVGVSWLLSRVRPLLLNSIGLGDIDVFTDIEPEEVFLWKDDNPIFKIVTKEEILKQSISALELSQRAMQRYLRHGLLPTIGVTLIPNKVFFEPLYEKLANQ
jgi:hypothetical protein